jgi:hypothetical protein
MTIARNFQNGFKGTIARSINRLAGRRMFGMYLGTTLRAIERLSGSRSATSQRRPTQ